MSKGARVVIVIVIVLALAQAVPEIVNTLLVLIIFSLVIMQSGQFAKMIAALKLN